MLNPVGVNLYFATDAGLLRRSGLPVRLLPTADTCTFDRATALVATQNRTVWLVGETKSQEGDSWQSQGLCQLSAGFLYSHWQAYTVANGRLPSDDVTALRLDNTGRLWASFGTNAHSSGGVAFYDGTAWQPLAVPENGLIQTPIDMVQSADSQLLLSHPTIDGLTIYTPTR